MPEYSDHDCGGPEVCSGCSSWRHGVYDDGSGSAVAQACAIRALRAELAEAHREMANALMLPQSATWDDLRNEATRCAVGMKKAH